MNTRSLRRWVRVMLCLIVCKCLSTQRIYYHYSCRMSTAKRKTFYSRLLPGRGSHRAGSPGSSRPVTFRAAGKLVRVLYKSVLTPASLYFSRDRLLHPGAFLRIGVQNVQAGHGSFVTEIPDAPDQDPEKDRQKDGHAEAEAQQLYTAGIPQDGQKKGHQVEGGQQDDAGQGQDSFQSPAPRACRSVRTG